jgi:hypothetical protein
MGQKEMLKHWRKLLEEAKSLLHKPEQAGRLTLLIENLRSAANAQQNVLEHSQAKGDEANYRLCVNTICEEFGKDAVPSGAKLEAILGRIEEAIKRATD